MSYSLLMLCCSLERKIKGVHITKTKQNNKNYMKSNTRTPPPIYLRETLNENSSICKNVCEREHGLLLKKSQRKTLRFQVGKGT